MKQERREAVPELERLLREAAKLKMTPTEIREQRISFAYGQMMAADICFLPILQTYPRVRDVITEGDLKYQNIASDYAFPTYEEAVKEAKFRLKYNIESNERRNVKLREYLEAISQETKQAAE